MLDALTLDLAAFPLQNGVRIISPPQSFDGGEEAYDEHIGGAHLGDALRSGRGAWQLAAHHATRPIRTLLEVGAGSGACTLGLVAAAEGAEILVTDTSPAFLNIVRRKLAAAGLDDRAAAYATLAGEELGRLPAGSVDAVVIASALHHVGDWRAFLADAASVLRPGGVLVIQEPFREGNLMMGMVLDMVLSPLWPATAPLPAEDVERITRFRDCIYFLANSTFEKHGEDKHSFLVTDLNAGADDAGFAGTVFYSNFHFQDLADADLSRRAGICSFAQYLDAMLEFHHRVSPESMQVLRQYLHPLLRNVDDRFLAGDGAPLLGCMVFRR